MFERFLKDMVPDLPPRWQIRPFWSVFRRVKQTGFSDDQLLSVYRDYGVIPRESRDDNFNRASQDLSNYQLVKPGYLATNKMKAWQGSIAISRYRGIVSPAYYVYEPIAQHDPQYIHYLLRSAPYVAMYRRISKGIRVAQWDLEHEALRRIPLLFPPIGVQQRIADFLDRKTARIDQAIEKQQRLIATLERRWDSALEHYICGPFGLDTDRNTDGHRTERHPSHWKLVSLKHLVDSRRPLMYGIVLPGPHVEDGVMIVKGGDVKPGRLSPGTLSRTTVDIDARHPRSRLREGDLVISIRGAVGDVEIVPAEIEGANLTQDAARIAPRSGVSNLWLRYALKAPSVAAQIGGRVRGAAVRGISIFDLSQIKIPTPPPKEQREIANTLVRTERKLQALTGKIRRHQSQLQEFRAALITEAVTGQITPTYSLRGG